MLAPDGRCKPFDAAANGYVRSEGAACVVLRPLDKALANHDRIYAVIRATFVNQDGRTGSMTVPSLAQQMRLLHDVYGRAGISPAQVSYVEAHGTGTPVGDPIEATALGRVLGCGGPRDEPLWIGSVKSNLGHLEPASGVAGLAKVHVGDLSRRQHADRAGHVERYAEGAREVVRGAKRQDAQSHVPVGEAAGRFADRAVPAADDQQVRPQIHRGDQAGTQPAGPVGGE